MLFNANPITSTIGLIGENLLLSSSCYEAWQNESLASYSMQVDGRRVAEAPVNVVCQLFPLSKPIRTMSALISAGQNWTAYFDNGVLGTDAAPVVRVMSRRLNCRALRVTYRQQTLSSNSQRTDVGDYGSVILEMFNNGDRQRSIFAANDGGKWTFGQSGLPLSFEDLGSYKKRKIKERFTFEMLLRYLDDLGVSPFDAKWYNNDAVIFQKSGNMPSTLTYVERE